MAYAGHVLIGSSGNNALLVLEGKANDVRTQDRPRRIWISSINEGVMWKTMASSQKRNTGVIRGT